MEHVAIESSHLASLGHEGTTLEVRFRNGQVWRYENVSEHEVEKLLANKSRGSAFAQVIRATKPGKRIR